MDKRQLYPVAEDYCGLWYTASIHLSNKIDSDKVFIF